MLILLDIDGVLVPANSWKQPEFLDDGFPVFNLRAVKALQRILSETDASVLLTTSHKTRYDIPQWENLLKTRGIKPKKIHRLASDSLQISRKEEILDWYENQHL